MDNSNGESPKKATLPRRSILHTGDFFSKPENLIRSMTQKLHRNILALTNVNFTPSNEQPTLDKIINILQTETSKRKIPEIDLLRRFLTENTLIKDKFKKDHISYLNYEKMLIICSTYMNFKRTFSKDMVYEFGASVDNFYLILKGEVRLFLPSTISSEMTGYEYFLKLFSLKNDLPVVMRTVSTNKDIYPIEPKDLPRIRKIILKLITIKAHGLNFEVTEDVFKFSQLEPYEIHADFKTMKENEIRSAIEYAVDNISDELCEKYKFLIDNEKKNKVTIFEMDAVKILKTGDILGESNDNRFSHRAVCEAGTYLCSMSNFIYNEYVTIENKKMKQRELNFIFDNFCFRRIVKRKFNREYFPLFHKLIFKKHEVLFSENDPVEYIYLIEDGNIELSTTKTILEMHTVIRMIKNISETLTANKFNVKDEFPNLQNQIKDLIKGLTQRSVRKIFIIGQKECLCAESLLYGLNNLFTGTVVSEELVAYKISVENLTKIFNAEEKSVYNDFQRLCNKKLNIIEERLIGINNTSLEVVDQSVEVPVPEKVVEKEKGKLNENSWVNTERLQLNHVEFLRRLHNSRPKDYERQLFLRSLNRKESKKRMELPDIFDIRDKIPARPINYLSVLKKKPFEDRFYEKIKKDYKNLNSSLISGQVSLFSTMPQTEKPSGRQEETSPFITSVDTSHSVPPRGRNLSNSVSGVNSYRKMTNFSSPYKERITLEKLKKYQIFGQIGEFLDYDQLRYKSPTVRTDSNVPQDASKEKNYGQVFREIYLKQKKRNKEMQIKQQYSLRYKKEIEKKLLSMSSEHQ